MPSAAHARAETDEVLPTIGFVGLRGFPGVQGGVERHCQELCTRLAAEGVPLVVFTRRPYLPGVPRWSTWRGVRRRQVFAPRFTYLETLCHTAAALVLARVEGIRIVHVHAIGPGLAVPLARLLGLRVVFTHHGRDYMRAKWGRFARATLQLGERLAVRHADRVIAVSREVEEWAAQAYGRTADYAANGVEVEARAPEQVAATVARFGLEVGRYVVAVARLVPEKALHELVEALKRVPEVGPLVIVGGADHASAYERELRARASETVRFLGNQPHEITLDLVRGARVFALPSHHEGLPIALLEALACGTPAVASDIAPHREVLAGELGRWLFAAGDELAMSASLRAAWNLSHDERSGLAADLRTVARQRYSWKAAVATATAAYRAVGGGARASSADRARGSS